MPPGTSSSAAAGWPTSSGPCSCCSCSTPSGAASCARPGTLPALSAAVGAGLLGAADGEVLAQAWSLASRWRNATALWRGRPVDSLPVDLRDLDGVARIVGYQPGEGQLAEDDYLRLTRRSRQVVERVFYA